MQVIAFDQKKRRRRLLIILLFGFGTKKVAIGVKKEEIV
jgi:hypothetical protein